jgi:hypothetical protein
MRFEVVEIRSEAYPIRECVMGKLIKLEFRRTLCTGALRNGGHGENRRPIAGCYIIIGSICARRLRHGSLA